MSKWLASYLLISEVYLTCTGLAFESLKGSGTLPELLLWELEQWLIFLFLPGAVLSEDEHAKWVSLHAVLSGPTYTLSHLLKNLLDNTAHVNIRYSCRIQNYRQAQIQGRREEVRQGWGREREGSVVVHTLQLNRRKQAMVQGHVKALGYFTTLAYCFWMVCRIECQLQGCSFTDNLCLSSSPWKTPRKRSLGPRGPGALLQSCPSHSFSLSLCYSISASNTRAISVPLHLRLRVFWKGRHEAITLPVTTTFAPVFWGKWPSWKWFISRPSP